MDTLNYHHLRYFREVALDGNLTRTAARVNLAQSALSSQIRTLEDRLGHPLFERIGRKLVLTEVGRIVLDHADRIFRTGEELVATLERAGDALPPLRVGALSTLSRNFQLGFLRPVLGTDADVILKSGSASVLLEALKALALDVVLTTEPPSELGGGDFTAHRIAEQTVGLHGMRARLQHPTLRDLLAKEPLIVPTESSIRTGFESLVSRLGITPRIAADVDDMAMVRLLAREDVGLAVAPAVVLADEIAAGLIETADFDLEIVEGFYAVTVRRNFPHPLLAGLIGR
ncbi:LysR family transcriptional regulator [Hoeflea olei]|uniref:LysR family transcriptional regulator n=1 Tax=Hoeflea olei TaxID=1480615 RepID=A0A1C1YTC2_9HYPH|nr:LysR family transcriptional regulator [Hoeflea olei]OCW56590.1 LysR family transcriptional regulator [Hoeflea olei]